jgi:hypothetical protein
MRLLTGDGNRTDARYVCNHEVASAWTIFDISNPPSNRK